MTSVSRMEPIDSESGKNVTIDEESTLSHLFEMLDCSNAKAICSICKAIIPRKFTGSMESSSPLVTHLRRNHPDIPELQDGRESTDTSKESISSEGSNNSSLKRYSSSISLTRKQSVLTKDHGNRRATLMSPKILSSDTKKLLWSNTPGFRSSFKSTSTLSLIGTTRSTTTKPSPAKPVGRWTIRENWVEENKSEKLTPLFKDLSVNSKSLPNRFQPSWAKAPSKFLKSKPSRTLWEGCARLEGICNFRTFWIFLKMFF